MKNISISIQENHAEIRMAKSAHPRSGLKGTWGYRAVTTPSSKESR